MQYTYPLKIHFRLLALAPRISLTDAHGKELLYIEQKVFALKEAVKVFDNAKEKNLLYRIQANQIIDFGATYFFHTANNQSLGSVQQDGMRSLYQASYSVSNKKEEPIYKVIQTNPMVGILDSFLNMIPFAEFVTGFILNPSYTLMECNGDKPLMHMKKKPSFFESEFEITLDHEKLSKDEEILSLLTFIMIVQLERKRG
jgi:uncharacterized protein YxjI